VGKRGPHPLDPSHLLYLEDAWCSTFRGLRDGKVQRRISGPAEQQLWEELKNARSAKRVREICHRSKYWLNPRWKGGHLIGSALTQHASAFAKALMHQRCPRSKRPSSDDRRMQFLAKAMTAAVTRKSIRRTEDLIREARKKIQPDFQCSCGHLKQEHCLTSHRRYCTKPEGKFGHCVFCVCTKFKFGGIRQSA
jgi:hypothetical protein